MSRGFPCARGVEPHRRSAPLVGPLEVRGSSAAGPRGSRLMGAGSRSARRKGLQGKGVEGLCGGEGPGRMTVGGPRDLVLLSVLGRVRAGVGSPGALRGLVLPRCSPGALPGLGAAPGLGVLPGLGALPRACSPAGPAGASRHVCSARLFACVDNTSFGALRVAGPSESGESAGRHSRAAGVHCGVVKDRSFVSA